jgi:hypothetical protein
MIGDRVLVGLENASKPVRDTIAATYPLSIDGSACRGDVRNNCGAPGNPQIPTNGLPASALDVIRTNAGQLGDVVVLATGYSDVVFSPSSNPPDLTPFNEDFGAVMTALQNEPRVQKVVVLNLRTGDARIPALQLNKYNAINGRLSQLATAGTYSKMVLADYNTASASWLCNGTNQGCYPTDPVIPGSSTGAVPFATWLKGTLDGVSATPGNDGETAPVGNRCLTGNRFGFAPYSGTTVTPQLPDAAHFNAVTPVRLLDTRAGRQLGAGQIRRLQVADITSGVTDIPANASAVALNVTATGECGPGYLTVFPCSPTTVPNTSNVNFNVGQNIPNAVTVRVGELGRVCVYASAQTDVIVDINGYYNDVGSNHTSTNPTRLVDTRTGLGGGALAANSIRQISLVGKVAVGTTGATLNVTALNPASSGYLTVFPAPCGNGNLPNASNVNYTRGQIVPNYVAVKVPNSLQICVYSSASTNLIVDLNATFQATGSTLKAVQPTRILDTRNGAKLQANVPLAVHVVSAAGLPGTTEGVLLNTTVVGPSGNGYVTVYPCGTAPPNASNLNYVGGQVVPNLVDAKIGTNGDVCVVSSAATNIIFDLTGYYSA